MKKQLLLVTVLALSTASVLPMDNGQNRLSGSSASSSAAALEVASAREKDRDFLDSIRPFMDLARGVTRIRKSRGGEEGDEYKDVNYDESSDEGDEEEEQVGMPRRQVWVREIKGHLKVYEAEEGGDGKGCFLTGEDLTACKQKAFHQGAAKVRRSLATQFENLTRLRDVALQAVEEKKDQEIIRLMASHKEELEEEGRKKRKEGYEDGQFLESQKAPDKEHELERKFEKVKRKLRLILEIVTKNAETMLDQSFKDTCAAASTVEAALGVAVEDLNTLMLLELYNCSKIKDFSASSEKERTLIEKQIEMLIGVKRAEASILSKAHESTRAAADTVEKELKEARKGVRALDQFDVTLPSGKYNPFANFRCFGTETSSEYSDDDGQGGGEPRVESD